MRPSFVSSNKLKKGGPFFDSGSSLGEWQHGPQLTTLDSAKLSHISTVTCWMSNPTFGLFRSEKAPFLAAMVRKEEQDGHI